jgi:hypothetical protein
VALIIGYNETDTPGPSEVPIEGSTEGPTEGPTEELMEGPTEGPTEAPLFVCPVCGEGKEVTLPDGVVSNPFGSIACTELEGSAAAGNISLAQCASLTPATQTPCGCMDVDTPSPVTITPSAVESVETPAPVAPSEPNLPPTLAPAVIDTPPGPDSPTAAPSGAVRNGAMALAGLSAAMMVYFVL